MKINNEEIVRETFQKCRTITVDGWAFDSTRFVEAGLPVESNRLRLKDRVKYGG